MDLPDWFDPAQDAMLTPKALRGLVHPIRIRLLQMLQIDGPATATSLAARIEQSSGVASYHLRVLAEHGFILEDTDRGTGRDRWWRAAHRETSFTFRMPEDPGDDGTVEDAELYLRLLANQAHRRVIDYVDSLAARRDELPNLPWQMNEWPIRLSVDEARALAAQVHELVLNYRREQGDPDPRPDTMRAVFQFQMLPDERPQSSA